MIVVSPDGTTNIISDSNISRVRNGGHQKPALFKSQVDTKVSEAQFEKLAEAPIQSNKVPPGSILEGTSPYIGSKDDTDLTYAKRREIRELLVEQPLAYNYIMDTPVEALYSPRPLKIAKQEWHDGDEGVKHVEDWLRLFEAIEHQENLMELCIGAAQYNREQGEVLAQVSYIQNDFLHLLGYPDNKMIGRIDLINPLLLQEVLYDPETGNVKSFELPSTGGQTIKFKGADLERFIWFHNRPSNEHRGITRLLPNKRWLESFDDLLEMILTMHYNDARPIEQHIMDEDGLLDPDIDKMWDEHEENVGKAINSKTRMIQTSERIKIVLHGMQGRTLQSEGLLNNTKDYIHQGLERPASFIEAKNANKATIDVQERHFQHSQLEAIDRACARRFGGLIFRKVLMTRGVDVRLTPRIAFPAFTTSNALEQAQTWEKMIELFGNPMREQIADEQGFAIDPVTELPAKKSPDLTEMMLKNNMTT